MVGGGGSEVHSGGGCGQAMTVEGGMAQSAGGKDAGRAKLTALGGLQWKRKKGAGGRMSLQDYGPG